MKNNLKLKNRCRLLSIGLIAMLLTIAMTGCGNSNNDSLSDKKQSKKFPIKIEDIDWSVDEGIVDGKRRVVLNYTNNTQYTITDLKLEFRQKEGITREELAVFNNYKEKYNKTDDELADVYIMAYNRKFADPGEVLENSPCVIDGTYIPVDNIAQYQIMQPDMATIAYIGKDEKLYGIYYDFKTQKYSWASEEGIEPYQWAEGELSDVIPKPNVRTVSCSESSTSLGFTSYGASKEQFNEYVQACKEKGFTVDPTNSENSYSAKNAEGYKLSIHYWSSDERLDGNLYTQ